MLLCGVLTSLLTAWALGPSGRGDLAVVFMWPNICAMLVEFGLPQACRYQVAQRPAAVSAVYSGALLFVLGGGLLALGLGQAIVPHLVGDRTPEVMRLVRVYLMVIPVAMAFDLLRALLEGARRFVWVGAARLIFFGVQAAGYLVLWLVHALTVETATYVMIGSNVSAMLLALVGVRRELRPRWQPSLKEFKAVLRYGARDYPGVLTEFTTLRLDQLVLGGYATSAAIGLYFVAVRLAEISAQLAAAVPDALMPEVAALGDEKHATALLTRSLRLTLYVHLCLLVPAWIVAPYLLRVAYGAEFLAATGTLRLLLLASAVWSAGAIVISGLSGLGHPGLSSTARLIAAAVTLVALFVWLPTRGIQGAALASLAGYGSMLVVALFWLARRRRISVWECLRPRRSDFPANWLRFLAFSNE